MIELKDKNFIHCALQENQLHYSRLEMESILISKLKQLGYTNFTDLEFYLDLPLDEKLKVKPFYVCVDEDLLDPKAKTEEFLFKRNRLLTRRIIEEY